MKRCCESEVSLKKKDGKKPFSLCRVKGCTRPKHVLWIAEERYGELVLAVQVFRRSMKSTLKYLVPLTPDYEKRLEASRVWRECSGSCDLISVTDDGYRLRITRA